MDRPYSDSRPVEIRELDLDPPRERELLVRVEAAGVCHSDLSVVDASRPRPMPMALGHEAAGIVAEVGDSISDVSVGDHVVLTFVPSCGTCAECNSGSPALCAGAAVANGEGRMLSGGSRLHDGGTDVHHHLGVSAFSQYAVVDRGSAVVIDDDIPMEVGAMLGCGVLTGVGSVLNTASVGPGETVAVFGLGGVGLSAVMGALVASAGEVLVVDPFEAKGELALELGADHWFQPADAVEAIRDLTSGGADHVIEASGSTAALAGAYACTRRGGTTVSVGLPHPDLELSIPAVSLAAEGRRLVGSYMGDAAPQRDIPRLFRLWRKGRLPVERLHSSTRPLTEVNEAFDALADGAAIRQILRPH